MVNSVEIWNPFAWRAGAHVGPWDWDWREGMGKDGSDLGIIHRSRDWVHRCLIIVMKNIGGECSRLAVN